MRKIKNYKEKNRNQMLVDTTIELAKLSYIELKKRFNEEDAYLKPFYKGILTQIINKLEQYETKHFNPQCFVKLIKVMNELGMKDAYKNEDEYTKKFLELHFLGNMSLYKLYVEKIPGFDIIWKLQDNFLKMWKKDVDPLWP